MKIKEINHLAKLARRNIKNVADENSSCRWGLSRRRETGRLHRGMITMKYS